MEFFSRIVPEILGLCVGEPILCAKYKGIFAAYTDRQNNLNTKTEGTVMRMKDKVCIITGSAQGIDRGIALCLAEEGAQVVITDLNGEKAAAVAEHINKTGGQAIGVKVDVGERTQVAACIAQTVKNFGKLDVLTSR